MLPASASLRLGQAVMAFSQRLVVLVSGNKIADGVPAEVIRNDDVVRAYLGQ